MRSVLTWQCISLRLYLCFCMPVSMCDVCVRLCLCLCDLGVTYVSMRDNASVYVCVCIRSMWHNDEAVSRWSVHRLNWHVPKRRQSLDQSGAAMLPMMLSLDSHSKIKIHTLCTPKLCLPFQMSVFPLYRWHQWIGIKHSWFLYSWDQCHKGSWFATAYSVTHALHWILWSLGRYIATIVNMDGMKWVGEEQTQQSLNVPKLLRLDLWQEAHDFGDFNSKV